MLQRIAIAIPASARLRRTNRDERCGKIRIPRGLIPNCLVSSGTRNPLCHLPYRRGFCGCIRIVRTSGGSSRKIPAILRFWLGNVMASPNRRLSLSATRSGEPGSSADGQPSARGCSRLLAIPRDDDVVVTCDDAIHGRYTVRQLPGGDQLSTPRRQEAIDLARRFAEATAVDVWLRDRGGMQLLRINRPPADG